jgi:hypothetical protein
MAPTQPARDDGLPAADRSSAAGRWGLLAITSGCLLIGGALYLYSPRQVEIGGILLRVGALLGAVWLAMPVISRPLQWMPPALIALLLGLGLVAAIRPRLLLLMIPMAGTVIALGGLARVLRAMQSDGRKARRGERP